MIIIRAAAYERGRQARGYDTRDTMRCCAYAMRSARQELSLRGAHTVRRAMRVTRRGVDVDDAVVASYSGNDVAIAMRQRSAAMLRKAQDGTIITDTIDTRCAAYCAMARAVND